MYIYTCVNVYTYRYTFHMCGRVLLSYVFARFRKYCTSTYLSICHKPKCEGTHEHAQTYANTNMQALARTSVHVHFLALCFTLLHSPLLHTRTNMHTHTYTHVHTHTHAHTHARAQTHVHAYAYIHTHVYTHAHAHAHTHAHARI